MQLDAWSLLERLIGFDTVSAHSNLGLIDWVADYLDQLKVSVRLTREAGNAKANLFATIGPMRSGGMVLSGHTDVVPPGERDWISDPFVATRRDDRVYGRGTADMKGFIALALSRIPQFQAAVTDRPVHLALSFDEEVGCIGVRSLLDDLTSIGISPSLALIGEPTGMRPANAHKGCALFTTLVTGLDGHSSAPHRAVNAIDAAAEIVLTIGRIAADLAQSAGHNQRFDPPFSTLNVGRIEGGTAFNVVARQCRIDWECRAIPGFDPRDAKARLHQFIDQDLLPRMRRLHADSSVTTESIIAVPWLDAEADGPAERLAIACCGHGGCQTVAFATEAGLFQAAGLSAIICGPGSITDAHRPNEFITLDQMREGGAFLDRLAEKVALREVF